MAQAQDCSQRYQDLLDMAQDHWWAVDIVPKGTDQLGYTVLADTAGSAVVAVMVEVLADTVLLLGPLAEVVSAGEALVMQTLAGEAHDVASPGENVFPRIH